MAKTHFNKDVTGTVDVTDPQAVSRAVQLIFAIRYPDTEFPLITRLYDDFAALYCGELDGFLACDTSYHDVQHVLDVSLAMARLIDGYEINHSEDPLGPDLAMVGLIVALFHDSGYIRRANEADVSNGAEYTPVHVSRSAQFMAEYLPTIGMQDIVALCGKLVHFTGYEFQPEQIDIAEQKKRVVGMLAGTADVIAQMADPGYLEKCRDRLYGEFEVAGVTKQLLADGSEQVVYASAEDLLVQTPDFIKNTITNRLEGHFEGLYHQVEAHFNGDNLYMQALERNCAHLESLIAQNDSSLLHGSSLNPTS